MLIQDDVWQPELHPAGVEIVNDRHRYLLVIGAKKSAKTISICHKMARHLYEVDNSHIGVIVKRQEVGRIGVWADLTEFVIQEKWQGEAGAIPYIQKPKVLADTKRRVFSVRNCRGGTSKVTLVSAFRQSEIEEMMKNTRFSMIYINEADQFSSTIFNASADQLRMEHMGVPESAHQLILDCNPPDEGDKHWIVKVFIEPETKTASWTRDFKTIRTFIQDNPWLTERMREDLINRYRSNPRQYSRYILGEIIPSAEGSIFEGIFDEQMHVIGEAKIGRPTDQWLLLLPPRDTNEIIAGWDPGDVNHACTFFTKRLHDGRYCYDVLDNVVSIDRPMFLRELTRLVADRMDYWEEMLRRRGAETVLWRHWSDPSAFTFKSGSNKGTAALEIRAASKGRINLRPVRKGPGSVASRISMMTKIIGDGRFRVSVLARDVVNSLIGLKPAKAGIKKTPLIHAFDALTYGISGEIGKDLEDESSSERPENGVEMTNVKL